MGRLDIVPATLHDVDPHGFGDPPHLDRISTCHVWRGIEDRATPSFLEEHQLVNRCPFVVELPVIQAVSVSPPGEVELVEPDLRPRYVFEGPLLRFFEPAPPVDES